MSINNIQSSTYEVSSFAHLQNERLPVSSTGKNGDVAPDQTEETAARKNTPSTAGQTNNKELTEDEKRRVQELQKIDQEVKAHEQAHIAAGGGYTRGGANYSYEVGPDGKRYAVAGEVSIDTSEVPDDPQATIAKMKAVKRAAMAPANPSGQDRQVASQAQQTETKAQAEAAQERVKESEEKPDVRASAAYSRTEAANAEREKPTIVNVVA